MHGMMVLLATMAQVPPGSDPSLERVRERLAAPPPRLVLPSDNADEARPKFRLSIEAVRPTYLNPVWEPDRTIPLYVHTARPLYHHEFLSMVTPDEFRASTLYPGIDVMRLIDALSRNISGEMREIRERRAREEVRKQLEWFKRLNGIP